MPKSRVKAEKKEKSVALGLGMSKGMEWRVRRSGCWGGIVELESLGGE